MKNKISFAAKAAGVGAIALVSTVAAAGSASAFTFTSTPGGCGSNGCTSPLTGPAVVNNFDFNSPSGIPAGVVAANLATGTTPNVSAAPLGDTTQYFFVNPTTSPVTLNFTAPGLRYFGLYWGSIDTTNEIEFFMGSNSLGVLRGTDLGATGLGDPLNPAQNRYVNVFFTQDYNRAVFRTSNIAFEVDNITTAVPEPTTMAGLAIAGGVGAFLKRRQKQAAQV